MAKKVYKNKFQRDEEAKKAARRKTVNKKKNTNTNRGQDSTKKTEKLFTEMLNMTDAERNERLNEIDIMIARLSKQIEIKEKIKGQEEAVGKLRKEIKRLEGEQRRLEVFPQIKDQVKKIMAIRDRMISKRAKEFELAKRELEEARRKEDRAKEIDDELKELDKYSKNFAQKSKLTDADKTENAEKSKRYNELVKEKEKLGKRGDIKGKVKAAEARVEEFNKGKTRIDTTISKCNMAWKMLFIGKSWDEIALASVEKFANRQKEEAEKVDTQQPTQQQPTQQQPAQQQSTQQQPTQQPFFGESETPKKGEVDLGEVQKEVAEKMKDEKLPVPKKKFAERFPRISKLPIIGKWIESIADKKINEEERIAKIAESLHNPAYLSRTKDDKDGEAAEKIEVKVPEKTETKAPEKGENKKTDRDLFIEYLRESVGAGHTETEKYKNVKTIEQEKSDGIELGDD